VLEKEKGQVLVLLPEIALTAQLLQRIRREFGFDPVVWHSGITPKKRADAWRSIHQGAARLVIGARSALFLPFRDLRMMIVDEEHDASYKQEEGVLYHARDMAVVRASLEKIPVVLASATPSLETWVNVEQGKYQLLHLPSRYGDALLPEVEIVDMRTHRVRADLWISQPLKKAMEETICRGNQTLLFLNRRGYAPLTLCRSCGHRIQCPNCSAWMVEHRSPPRMLCHHCGHQHVIPAACPGCQQTNFLVACGPGVERLEEEVRALFPNARIELLSSESISAVGSLEDKIARIEANEVDIVIGTQMVAKGHHFPSLTLVGVVDADLGLAGGDLRAAERTYQLLHQVSGRAGREKEPGKVLIQSYMPDNTVIRAMSLHSRNEFMQEERRSREWMQSPPFGRMAAIIISGKKEADVKKLGNIIVRQFPRQENIRVLGPAPAPLSLVRKQFRYRILIKAPKSVALQKLLRQLLFEIKIPSALRVKIDIDPHSFM
jgi:primosomal protein N' (replication factor Y)